MNIYIHRNGQRVAEVFNLQNLGNLQWAFICQPPVLVADEEYEIFPDGGRKMSIMISNITCENGICYINAIETAY